MRGGEEAVAEAVAKAVAIADTLDHLWKLDIYLSKLQ
jgi:hypothetical protein